jgi:hypothetical protein
VNRHGFFDPAEEILLLVGGQFRRRLFRLLVDRLDQLIGRFAPEILTQ